MLIEYWADYICPWCYLALDRVDHLTRVYGADVVWNPYELHPEIPERGEAAPRLHRSPDTIEYLQAELERAGLPISPRRAWSNSASALALSAWARPRPEWPLFHRALYDAYWARGADIGDHDQLGAIAASVGIPSSDAADALALGAGRDGAAQSKERALDLGIAATPGWRFGEEAVLSGAHPRETFDRVMSRFVDAGNGGP